MDYTAITSAVDFTSALTAVGTIAAALGALYIGMKGAKAVLSFLR
jgi:hypothetical protein